MMNIESYLVNKLPPTCYYVPNFITESEEKLYLYYILKTPVNLLEINLFLKIKIIKPIFREPDGHNYLIGD